MRTARVLGEKMEVSDKTIYRELSDLVGSGIPIDGEAGVGYLLRDEYRLPPLMFNSDELKALALGAQMVRAWADRKLASTTATAIRKIESVLPANLKKEIKLNSIKVPGFRMSEALSNNLEMVRIASDQCRKLEVCHRSIKGEDTRRTIWPSILYFWGNKWTVGAWCELREAFRSFRVDLMTEVVNSEETFEEVPGRNLQAYIDYQSE